MVEWGENAEIEGEVIQEIITSKTSSERQLAGREVELLRALYSKIWTEAFYDCDTEDSRKYAQKLIPMIQELNELIGFCT